MRLEQGAQAAFAQRAVAGDLPDGKIRVLQKRARLIKYLDELYKGTS